MQGYTGQESLHLNHRYRHLACPVVEEEEGVGAQALQWKAKKAGWMQIPKETAQEGSPRLQSEIVQFAKDAHLSSCLPPRCSHDQRDRVLQVR